jgi:hypothetical protein
VTSADWQPARIGNFSGNPNGSFPVHDILRRNARGGAHAIWSMNGTSMTSGRTC